MKKNAPRAVRFQRVAALGIVGVVFSVILAISLKKQPDFTNWRQGIQGQIQGTRDALAPTPEECGAMNPAECRWVYGATRILKSSVAIEDREGESLSSRLSKMSVSIEQAQADALELPVAPPRCIKAQYLLKMALSEAGESVKLAQQAVNARASDRQEVVKAANEHRVRAGKVYDACLVELQRLWK